MWRSGNACETGKPGKYRSSVHLYYMLRLCDRIRDEAFQPPEQTFSMHDTQEASLQVARDKPCGNAALHLRHGVYQLAPAAARATRAAGPKRAGPSGGA